MTDIDSIVEEFGQKLAFSVEDIKSKLAESALAESDVNALMKQMNSLVGDVAEIKKVVCQSQVEITSLRSDFEKLKQAVSTGATVPSGDKTPANTLNLIVKSIKDGACINVIHFRIRSHQVFKKLFKAYCDKMKVELSTVQFKYNGKVIQDNESPLQLEMKNFDMILAKHTSDPKPIGTQNLFQLLSTVTASPTQK